MRRRKEGEKDKKKKYQYRCLGSEAALPCSNQTKSALRRHISALLHSPGMPTTGLLTLRASVPCHADFEHGLHSSCHATSLALVSRKAARSQVCNTGSFANMPHLYITHLSGFKSSQADNNSVFTLSMDEKWLLGPALIVVQSHQKLIQLAVHVNIVHKYPTQKVK